MFPFYLKVIALLISPKNGGRKETLSLPKSSYCVSNGFLCLSGAQISNFYFSSCQNQSDNSQTTIMHCWYKNNH